jgi:hypothetical protein
VADGPLFIGAVDPRDPARLLVRHLHAKGSDLYLTRDGGRTFANVLTMTSAMFGFAKSADGKTIWAGSGLPEHGLFQSTDRGEHFEPVARHGILCLHAAGPNALFLCENALTAGAPAIAVARDGVGKTITPLARFADIAGPISCATPDARASLCAESWPEIQALVAPPSNASDLDAGRSRDRASDANASPAARADPVSPARSACGCEVVGQGPQGAGVWWLLAACVFLPLIVTVRARITAGSQRIHTPRRLRYFGRRQKRPVFVWRTCHGGSFREIAETPRARPR